MNRPNVGSYTERAFQVIKFKLAQVISERELVMNRGGIEPSVYLNEAARQLVMQLQVFLVKGHTENTSGFQTVEYPADWWQAFKARWFDCRLLRWYLRRRPVKKTIVRVPQAIMVTRVCPHLAIDPQSARDGRVHIAYLTDEQRW